MYLYIHMINIHSTHTLCKQKLLFWMWLIMINRLTVNTLIKTFMPIFAIFVYKFLKENLTFYVSKCCVTNLAVQCMCNMFFYINDMNKKDNHVSKLVWPSSSQAQKHFRVSQRLDLFVQSGVTVTLKRLLQTSPGCFEPPAASVAL